MYICEDCGKIYEDEEVETVDEMPYGERHCGLGKPIWDMSRVEVEACSCGGEHSQLVVCSSGNAQISCSSSSTQITVSPV